MHIEENDLVVCTENIGEFYLKICKISKINYKSDSYFPNSITFDYKNGNYIKSATVNYSVFEDNFKQLNLNNINTSFFD